jgi:hypothetical protein
MPYRVHLQPSVVRKIANWGLSDPVLVDVHLFLRELLPTDPSGFLRRARRPFDGMVFEFSFIDPENRLREYEFTFLVLYSQDE